MTARTIIIGLLGPAGAGKSSIAKYLVEHYGAKVYSLAGPLKEIAKRTLDFSDEQLYGTQEQKEAIDPRYGFSCRSFLQRLGTEGCRAVLGDDVWTKACLDKIERERPPVAVIDDVRFKNEAALISGRRCWLPSLGYDHAEDGQPTIAGTVWRVEPPLDARTAERAVAAGEHASEREWREAKSDYVIAPTARGLEELFRLVDHGATWLGLVRS